MGHVEPDEAAIAAMRSGDPDEPIVMLNLIKFRERALDGFGVDGLTGQEAYMRYGELNTTENVRYGNERIWAGLAHRTIIGDEDWDVAALVRYPSRQHFIDKMNDPKYREVAKVRAAAITDSRLIELTELTAPN